MKIKYYKNLFLAGATSLGLFVAINAPMIFDRWNFKDGLFHSVRHAVEGHDVGEVEPQCSRVSFKDIGEHEIIQAPCNLHLADELFNLNIVPIICWLGRR